MPSSLLLHEQALRRDLDLLGLPPRNWPAQVRGPDDRPLIDVLIVGAGMCGLAAAAALMFKGVRNLVLLDQAEPGQEGPWVTTARMRTLRSPKHLPGIALGIPALTFRAWYEATQGPAAWESLYKIPNADWMDYLSWFRRVLDLPVRNGVVLRRLRPHGTHVEAETSAGPLRARHVVLATGRAGAGGLAAPACLDPALWPDRAAHTGEPIDFAALRGKRVAVLGAGSAAWDNAATALEAGAAAVDMYVRRPVLPQVNKSRGSSHPGYFEGWSGLPDAERWRLLVYFADHAAPPPHETVLRTLACPGFNIHLATPILTGCRAAGEVRLTLGPTHSEVTADFLIAGTGFMVDLAARPELADLVPHLATWASAYPPAAERPELGRFPYLGEGFELTPRPDADCPGLARVRLFNHAAFASHGGLASDIPGISTGAERLASGLAAALFAEDAVPMQAALEAFAEPELESTPFFAPHLLTGP